MTDRPPPNDPEQQPYGEIVRELEQLGPLMARQETAEVDADPAFQSRIRSRLLGESPPQLSPEGEGSRIRPVPRRARTRWTAAVGALILLLAFGVGFALLHPASSSSFASQVPYPSRQDLIAGFPRTGPAGGRLAPLISSARGLTSLPFAGRLHLAAPPLPSVAQDVLAYRLAAPARVSVLAPLLHIRSVARQVGSKGDRWMVAADGGAGLHHPLHSLAVSLTTGELIYHDRRNFVLPHATRPLDRTRTIAAARSWLSHLGWPGRRMPLLAIGTVHGLPHVRTVSLGWIHTGATALNAATLWVTPDRSVVEALVWPPVVQSGRIPGQSAASAWKAVQRQVLPVAVRGISPLTRIPGTGRLVSTSLVSVLSPGRRGRAYLVPVYRFAGLAHLITGPKRFSWLAYAPSKQH
jgi:hypothetical protein